MENNDESTIQGVMIGPLIGLTDPLQNHTDLTPSQIMEWCGFIPHWLYNVSDYDSIKECLIDQYDYYSGEMSGGTIDDKGVYTYPEDPPLYPLITVYGDGEIFHQYNYGIVATVQKDGTQWIARMD